VALHLDGTIKHGTQEQLLKAFTNEVKDWWLKIGGKLPAGL
jgi:hypothetical protein